MKLFLLSVLALFVLSAYAAPPTTVNDGVCGEWRPSWRVTGSSSISKSKALADAKELAKKSCLESCNNRPGSGTVATCGIQEYLIENDIHFVTLDSLCSCAF